MRCFLLASCLLLATLLSGCSGLKPEDTPPVPRTFQESSYTAAQALLAARETLDALDRQGILPGDSVKRLGAALDGAREGIVRARKLWMGGSNSTATTELDAAVSILKQVREELGRYERRAGTTGNAEASRRSNSARHLVAVAIRTCTAYRPYYPRA